MRSRSYLFLLLVLALSGISLYTYSVSKYQFGLDVQGGVRFVYQIKPEDEAKLDSARKPEVRANIIRVLENRVASSLGVVEGAVAPKGDNQFIVELPGFTNPEEAQKVLGTSASIRFYDARNVVTERDAFRQYEVYRANDDPDSPEVWFRNRTTGEIIKPFLEEDANGVRVKNPAYKAIIDGWGNPIVEGAELTNAIPQQRGSSYIPLMTFSPEGARKMEDWTRRYYNRRQQLAAVLDDVVVSIAPVEDGTILTDNAVITGDFSVEYVKNLTNLLRSGALPVNLEIQSSESVDPTIGKFALSKMVTAGLVAFGLIALFLIAYYAFPGFVALLALLIYVLFTLTVLKVIGATFSLAAIAGFILSIGMAVDANILVFERFKEEMKAGKGLKRGIELGFGRALPAIVDSNMCTILTSLVLMYFGTGPVKGFATTLIIGVAISLFTAVTVTRSLLVFFVGSGIAANPKWYAVQRNWFGEKFEDKADSDPFLIVQKSKKWFAISAISIVVFLPFWFIGGLKPSVEFRGGYEVTLPLAASQSQGDLQARLRSGGFEGANVKVGGTDAQRVAYVTVPLEVARQDESAQDVAGRVAEAAQVQTEGLVPATYIGPTIQAETIRNAFLGVILSSALIVVYLAFRFGAALGNFYHGLRFGFSAIGALVHDVMVVIGITAVVGYFLNWEISALFITSMLTVIGFSVHDTIVIFDRIRENLRNPLPNEDFAHLVNRSITQSFARSINTSMTVIATLIILLAMGTATPDLKLFTVTMLAGIVSGTYSSIYNASPILYLWDRWVAKKKGEEHTLVAAARREMAHARIVSPVATSPAAGAPATGDSRSYGQVRRRASAPQNKKRIEIEEP